MKKQLSLIIVLSMCISHFSAFGAQPIALERVQQQINEVEATHAQAVQLLLEEKVRKLQELRQPYEQALKLLDAQLADANQAITNQFKPQLAQADAAQAVSLREKIARQKEEALQKYNDAVALLKRSYNKAIEDIKEKVGAAERSLKNQLTTFKRGVKQTGQAAVNAAKASFLNFGITIGTVLAKSIDEGLKQFKMARKTFKMEMQHAGWVLKGIQRRMMRTVSQKIGSMQKAITDRWSSINAGLKEGKERLVKDISMLKQRVNTLKNKVKAIGTGTLSQEEQAKLNKEVAALGTAIVAVSILNPVAAISYRTATLPVLAKYMYETGKKKLTAPIQKMAASYRAFKAKLNCLGNAQCTVEQRKEAVKAFRQLYFTIIAVEVAALFGTVLASAMLDERERARQEGTRHQLPSEQASLRKRLEARRPVSQQRPFIPAEQAVVEVSRPERPMPHIQEHIKVTEELTPAEEERLSELIEQKTKESFKVPTAEGRSPFYAGE